MTKKKSRMGRPPKDPKERMTAVINVRLKPSERKEIEREAKRTGRSLSEVVMYPWRDKRKAE